ncbi:hypothetical protein DCC85_13555 [Paenibacillus sp. CAA11]|uniref:hypothetical protein n=1 Tax=Paenibacillus sp. CAA11 TaxID=1532905 RepID=UPI000D381980|nr:hypothetical protein [Paenibacillus sp. CAA11]AWB45150.1 hypothetical protein DCC85_13555 [Paenibacillus sp. CAA11]
MDQLSSLETEEDLQLIKEYILFPVLLDMLERDMEELSFYNHKTIYNHLLHYLKDIEALVHLKLQSNRRTMRNRRITILQEEFTTLGIRVDYKVRGYIHHFEMLRSLVKAELMSILRNLRRQLS